MLSSLFQSRNSSAKPAPTSQLFELTTKKVQLPKPKSLQQSQAEKQQAILKASSLSQIAKKQSKKQPNVQIIQKDRPQATIFVGNVHLETKHNQLKNLFTKYGKVQKVWFRSIPVQVTKMGRKAAHVLKKYIDGADSMNAYVRFQQDQSATKACAQNGTLLRQLTIRVTLEKQKQQDTQATIFVGNLSHDIKEQQLRDHFSSIGKIVSVRVIKDRQTNKGIGIGYVHFQTKQEMKEAIKKLNNTQLVGRKVRVKKAVQKDRLQKKQKKMKQKFGKKYKTKKPQGNKNTKFIQIRKKGKQIKLMRQANKTKQIQKRPWQM